MGRLTRPRAVALVALATLGPAAGAGCLVGDLDVTQARVLCDGANGCPSGQCCDEGVCRAGTAAADNLCTDAAGGACANTFDCRARAGNDAFCIDDVCTRDVPVLPDGLNCRVIEPEEGVALTDVDWLREGPYLIGGLFRDIGKEADPDGSDHPAGVKQHLATRLAIQEINARGGLPGGERFGLVSCEYGGGKQVEGLDFMSADLGLRVVVSSTSSGRTQELVQHLVAADPPLPTAYVATTSTAPSLSAASLDRIGEAEHGLLWRIPPTDDLQALALARLILAEADRGRLTKLGIAYTEETYGQDIERLVRGHLEGLEVESIRVGFDPDEAPGAQLTATRRLGAAGAEAILLAGPNADFALGVIGALADQGATPDRYLAPDGALSESALLDPELSDGAKVGLSRLVGTAPTHRSGAAWDTVHDSLAQLFDTGLDDPFLAHSYDGGWVAALALARSGRDGGMGRDGTAFDGIDVAASIASLASGERLEVGAQNWSRALDLLRQSPFTLDLEGTSGPLDFDPASGDPQSAPIELWAVAFAQACVLTCQTCADTATCELDMLGLDECTARPCPGS